MEQHKAALNKGVLSVAVAAGNNYFKHYRKGILDTTACPTSIDHGVAMTGYGSLNGVEYWIIRNSWGPRWGLKGYIKLAIHEGIGICGCQGASF